MAQKSPVSQEARLQKLKEEIALRKQQRQQKLLQQSQGDAQLLSPNQQTVAQRETAGQKTLLLSPKPKSPEQESSLKLKGKTPRKKLFQNDKPLELPPAETNLRETQSKSKKQKRDSLQELSETDKSQNETEKLTPATAQGKTKRKKQRTSLNLSDSDTALLPNKTKNETPEVTSSPRKVKKAKKRKLSETEQQLDEETPSPRPSRKAKRAKKESVSDEDLPSNETEAAAPAKASCKFKQGKRRRLSDAGKMLDEFAKDCPGKVSYTQENAGSSDKVTVETASKETAVQDEEEEIVEEEEDTNTVGGFSVLGTDDLETAKPVKRELPRWLREPVIIKAGAGLRQDDCDDDDHDDAVMNLLDEDLRKTLRQNEILHFFPVQRVFIREIWEDLARQWYIEGGRGNCRPCDICVSAPTGSGKTLAYVLPIIQTLKRVVSREVSAVVVLPVRDLAEQVYHVFSTFCSGTHLKVGLAVGKTTISVEQESLVVKRFPGYYHSLVDILVATPGRLVDHINSTPGFDLSHLRFLVIDEADRMMEDILRHDWLRTVVKAAYTEVPDAYFSSNRSEPPPQLTMHSAQVTQRPLQKLLFSATLSHNPEKLEQLNLFHPRLMTYVVSNTPSTPLEHRAKPQPEEVVDDKTEDTPENADGEFVGKYTTPEGLTEYVVEGSAGEKPLVMLHFLHNLKFRSVLCFTNTVESTHRLCLLLKLFGGLRVREFSSRLPAERRKKILKQFSKGKIDLLVCSDAMARGMDLDNVKYVISYDNPPYIKTYVHRVGRTARAGRAGTAISLLEKKEFFHFKKMMREAGKWASIREMKVKRQMLKALEQPFREALAKLPNIIKEENKKKHPK